MKKFFVLLLIAFFPVSIVAQTVLFVPEKEIIDQNEISRLDIRIDTNGYFINVIELYVLYPDPIEIVDISTNNSFVNLWVSDPRIDTVKNEISFIGGLTLGTVMNDGLLASILVQGSTASDNNITIDQERSGVHLDDGMGTRIPLSSIGATISVSSNVYIPTIEIVSSTHPKEDVWYSNKTLQVAWRGFTEDVFSYVLSKDFFVTPDSAPEGEENTKEYSSLEDGEYIFSVQKEITSGTWSDISRRRFRIDTTPPSIEDVNIVEDNSLFDGNSVLIFNAQDTTSGISSIDIIEGDTRHKNITSPYYIKTNSDTITIIAEDYAGNQSTIALTREVARQVSFMWYIIGLFIVILGFFIIRLIGRHGTLPVHDDQTND